MGDAQFDTSKAYAAQEEVFFDDGREIELLHFIYGKSDIDSIRGSPARVLAAIDEFGRTQKYLMNVGEDKGKIVCDLIRETKPRTMVELGGYIGYSAILFASTLLSTSGPTAHYYTLERNPSFAAVILSLLDLAGLSQTASVIVGPSDTSLSRLHSTGHLAQGIDMMFLDHYKPAYTTDLKLCEELGLIHKGTVLAADNVIKPGNPPYLEYVRSSCAQKRDAVSSVKNGEIKHANGHVGVDERFAARSADQYVKREGVAKLDTSRLGNPNVVYESRLVRSWEPTGVPDGVEITRCLGEDERS